MPPPKQKKKKKKDCDCDKQESGATFSPEAQQDDPEPMFPERPRTTKSPMELWHPPWMKGEMPEEPAGVNDWEAYPEGPAPQGFEELQQRTPYNPPTWAPPLYYFKEGPTPIPNWEGPPPGSKPYRKSLDELNLERMKQGLMPLDREKEVY